MEYAKDGKMITKTGKEVITDIVFDHTLVYSTDQIAVNNGDLKLKEGTVFLRIIDQDYYDNSHRVVLEDRNAPSPGTAFIRLTYYPGKDAGQVSGIEEIYPEWWEGILVEKVYDVNTGKQVITTMPEHHYTGMENGHGYVDLGLSTMWATCNVGADNPVEYGDYFAWGETEPYYKPGYARAQETKWKKGKERGYSWSSYSYCEGSESTMTKYCVSSTHGQVDDKHILELADDAALDRRDDVRVVVQDGGDLADVRKHHLEGRFAAGDAVVVVGEARGDERAVRADVRERRAPGRKRLVVDRDVGAADLGDAVLDAAGGIVVSGGEGGELPERSRIAGRRKDLGRAGRGAVPPAGDRAAGDVGGERVGLADEGVRIGEPGIDERGGGENGGEENGERRPGRSAGSRKIVRIA